MRRERILEYLRAGLRTLQKGGALVVVAPNEVADVGNAEFFLETYVAERDACLETERGVKSRVDGVVVLNARLGEGAARLDAAAERVARFFEPGAPGARGFTARDGTRRALVYPTGVRRATPEVVDGRYKTSVAVEFEIFEEE